MFFAMVEADTGELLNLRYPEGGIGGNPLLSFWGEVHNYCSGLGMTEFNGKWWQRLEDATQKPLCEACVPLLNSFCDGNWEYKIDEYDRYVQRTQEPRMSECEFIENVRFTENAWVDAGELLVCTNSLTENVKASVTEAEYEPYHLPSLIKDLEALSDTVALLIERDASEVRIKIF
jgi:hypothetical protein